MEHTNQRRLKMQARILTLIAVACAITTVAMAAAWKREHDRAACWQTVAEGETAPEGECL